jgi:hypothetical protein
MGRIVEMLVGLNALGGIMAFLGFRWAGRKARDRVLGWRKGDDQQPAAPDGTPGPPASPVSAQSEPPPGTE